MKKILRITGITLLSILIVIIIAVSIMLWFVLTPSRITPFVQNTAKQYINCDLTIGEANITLFKNFPHLGVEISDVILKKQINNEINDTVASLENCDLSFNVRKFIWKRQVIVDKLSLENTKLNLFVADNGAANFDIFITDTLAPDTLNTESEFSLPFSHIELNKIQLKNCNIQYTDATTGTTAFVDSIFMNLNADLKKDDLLSQLNIQTGKILCRLPNDSVEAKLNQANVNLDCGLWQLKNLEGEAIIKLDSLSFTLANENLIQSENLILTLPLKLALENPQLFFNDAVFKLGESIVKLSGQATTNQDNDILCDFKFNTNYLNIETILSYMPQEIIDLLDGMIVKGQAMAVGTIQGVANDSLLPTISTDIICKNTSVTYSEYLPKPLTQINGNGHLNLNLTNEYAVLTVENAKGKLDKINIDADGSITDLLYDMNFDINARIKTNLADAKIFIPSDLQVNPQGELSADIAAQFNYEQLDQLDLKNMKIDGVASFSNMNLAYDTITVTSKQLNVNFSIPGHLQTPEFKSLMYAKIETDNARFYTPKSFDVTINDMNLAASTTDFMDNINNLSTIALFDFAQISGDYDTIHFALHNPSGSLSMLPSRNDLQQKISISYSGDKVLANMGQSLFFNTKSIELSAKAMYNENGNNILAQWNPELYLNLESGLFKTADLPFDVDITHIKLDLTKDSVMLYNSEILLGESDLNLNGTIKGLENYIQDKGLLVGRFDFESQYTNIDQIMALTSGLGAESDTTAEKVQTADTTAAKDNPFIVPLGVDFSLKTIVKNADYGSTQLNDIGGQLTVKDGVLVLEQMGFTTHAARMQLTAMYKSPRKNHIFAGIDFHLLDIDIDELISMIPTVDTIMPMLKSFDGNAEFHLAFETYLKSNYELKMSTLKGAAAIEGKNLTLKNSGELPVILDKLKVTQKGDLLVDSLSCELTVLRNEVDIYPFLISMHNYQAVVSGRHNLDMTFDYHIDIVETPAMLSIARMGLDVKGSLNDLKYSVTPSRYANLYKPEKRNALQNQTLEFKSMISNSLKSNVKPY